MKRIYRLFAALTVILVTTQSCAPMKGDMQTEGTSTVTDPAETEIKIEYKLPELDYGGKAINFLVRGEKYEPTNFSHEIYASEANGDIINDVVYKRNVAIEERYNCKITETADDDSVSNVRASVLAGDGLYDVVMVRPNRMITLAQEGLLSDLYKVPHIDLSQAWWDGNAVRELTVNNSLYFVNGDINIMDNNAIWTVMFNKNLFDKYKLEYPYETVKKGGWTLTRFLELAKFASDDLDGNSKMDETDQYGVIMSAECVFPFIVASGDRLCIKDGGTIKLSNNFEKVTNILDLLLPLSSDTTVTLSAESYSGKGYSNPWSQVMRAAFKEGRGLLYVSGILSSTYLRDMNDEFGILPLPKFDDKQVGYRSWMHTNNSSMLALPVTNQDNEAVGLIVEAMAYESASTLTPAYYDTTLSGKVARDSDSIEMLDIIINSVVYDFANIYNIGGINDIINKGFMTGINSFASDYESIREKAQIELDKILGGYKEVSG